MATHGNYKHYQGSSRFDGANTAAHVVDARVRHISAMLPALFLGRRVLDVGCNRGDVAVDIGLRFRPAAVTGVDIDPELVARAKSHLSFQWSRVGPDGQPDYFPISAVLEHGHRPFPRDVPATDFPRCVAFRCEDWALRDARPAEREAYDVILALSVVKWIHLHHRDEGLKRFFAKCYASVPVGGHLVLEFQDWLSYQKAGKKVRELKTSLELLKLRPEGFRSILEELGFELVSKLEEGLKRRIEVYQKKR